jgi:hypothetical protein
MLELKEDELRLVEEIEVFLDSRTPEESRLLRGRFDCLRDLGKAISGFPSVRESQMLRGVVRDEQQLLDALCSFGTSSHLLHIPSRVVMSRSYLVAKYQAFSLVFMLVKDYAEFQKALRHIIFSLIHTLMIEEVYFSCLDDPEFSREVKVRVADDLITLWDSGTDARVVRHLPAFDALWTARDSNPPAFGTMNGSSELLRITIDMETDWQEFLIEEAANTETRQALEEFLFGLSFEEINDVRSRLARFGIGAVNHDELRTYLGSKPAYEIVSASDFRAIYNFYVDRRDMANLRKKVGNPGPMRTLEEIYLRYRIARE